MPRTVWRGEGQVVIRFSRPEASDATSGGAAGRVAVVAHLSACFSSCPFGQPRRAPPARPSRRVPRRAARPVAAQRRTSYIALATELSNLLDVQDREGRTIPSEEVVCTCTRRTFTTECRLSIPQCGQSGRIGSASWTQVDLARTRCDPGTHVPRRNRSRRSTCRRLRPHVQRVLSAGPLNHPHPARSPSRGVSAGPEAFRVACRTAAVFGLAV
jgi:hypothetical protein